MAISSRPAYIFNSNKQLTAQGSLSYDSGTGVYTFSETKATIEQGEVGTVQVALILPLATFSGGTPLVIFRRKDGYTSGLLTMSTATWVISVDSVETSYQVLYVTMSVVGWTYTAGRHALQASYLKVDGSYDKIDLVFYTVDDGINNYEEITADTYEEIATQFNTTYADLLDRMTFIETFAINGLGYNETGSQTSIPFLKFYNALGLATISFDGSNFILNRNSVDEEVMTVLNNLADLANVVETSLITDDILIYNGTNYVNITKTAFLAAVNGRIDTNVSNIADRELISNKVDEVVVGGTTDQYVNASALYTKFLTKEDKTNKITAWDTPTDVQYPSAKLVHDELKTLLKTATYNSTNGVMTFTKYDGSTITIDLPLELIIESGSYDAVDNDLVFILANGNEIRVPVDNLLTDLDAVNVRYDNTLSDLIATNVKAAIDELDTKHEALDTRVGTAETNITNLQAKDIEHEKDLIEHEQRIDSIEAITRKQDSDIASVDDDGIGILHIGKDVAETTVTTKIEGLLLDSEQLVSNAGNPFTATTGWTSAGATISIVTNYLNMLASAQGGSARYVFTTVNATKYYIIAIVKTTSNLVALQFRNGATFTTIQSHSGSNTFETLSGIVTMTSGNANDYLYIGDSRTSGWDNVSVGYVYNFNISTLIANKQYSPLYSTTFDLMNDAQIKAQMDLWVQDGTLPNSIMSVDMDKRVTSVGKNLFDKSKYATDYAYKISVKPNTQYIWSISALYKTYDKDMNEVSSGTNTTLTVASNVHYIAFSGIANIDTFQLEQNSVTTTYENYRSSSMYLDSGEVGYSLPNSTKDTIEFRNGRAYFNRTVKLDTTVVKNAALVNTSQDDLWTNGGAFGILSTSLTTLGMKSPSANNIIGGVYLVINDETYKVVDFNNFINQDGNNAVSLSSTGVLYLAFNDLATKGITKENISSAQAYLQENDVSFYYELATPIETPISVIGNAMAYPNGTFLIEDVVRRSGVYSSGITVDKAISELDNIYKLNDDGSSTKLEVSGATVAGDGLSFTHTSLSNGDFVWFDYYYQGTNVKGLSTVYYYGDKMIVADTTTGTVYKIIFTIDNGVITVDKVAV